MHSMHCHVGEKMNAGEYPWPAAGWGCFRLFVNIRSQRWRRGVVQASLFSKKPGFSIGMKTVYMAKAWDAEAIGDYEFGALFLPFL